MPLSKSDLALYQKLHRRPVRQAESLWLVEGLNAVKAALKANLPPVCVLTSQEAMFQALQSLLPSRMAHQVLEVVPDTLLARIATTDSPPPVLGVFQARHTTEEPQSNQRWLVLSGLQDPGNAGTLIRCLRAFNGHGLLVTPGTVDVYSPKVIRATTGEVFHVPVVTLQDWTLLDNLPLWGTRATDAEPYEAADWSSGGALVLGQEGNGLNALDLPPRTRWLCIPQNTAVDSLNVAVAGAIIMAQWMR